MLPNIETSEIEVRAMTEPSEYTEVELPVENFEFDSFCVEGNGKRKWARMMFEDGRCCSVDAINVQISHSEGVKCRVYSLDDSEFCVEYRSVKIRRVVLSVWQGVREEILNGFADGVRTPIGSHHRRLWAGDFVGAENVLVELEAGG